MDRYIIETPHTGPECLVLIKLIGAFDRLVLRVIRDSIAIKPYSPFL